MKSRTPWGKAMWERLGEEPGIPYQELLIVGVTRVNPGRAWRAAEYWRRFGRGQAKPGPEKRRVPYDTATVVRSGARRLAYRTLKQWRYCGHVVVVDGRVYRAEQYQRAVA